jgi:hypothetical protein
MQDGDEINPGDVICEVRPRQCHTLGRLTCSTQVSWAWQIETDKATVDFEAQVSAQ